MGGEDVLENLQPMHKHCNNEDKQAIAYKAEYNYDIKSDLEDTVYRVRITVSKKRADAEQEIKCADKKERYNNRRCHKKRQKQR